MLEKLDEHISELSESIARTMNRRQLLTRTVKGVFATAAGLTLAQFTNLKSAFAITCTCMWAGGSGNANCPHTSGCPGGINPPCPSGCVTCTTSSGCGTICNYPGGSWCRVLALVPVAWDIRFARTVSVTVVAAIPTSAHVSVPSYAIIVVRGRLLKRRCDGSEPSMLPRR